MRRFKLYRDQRYTDEFVEKWEITGILSDVVNKNELSFHLNKLATYLIFSSIKTNNLLDMYGAIILIFGRLYKNHNILFNNYDELIEIIKYIMIKIPDLDTIVNKEILIVDLICEEIVKIKKE